ncbi:MAG: hypothetical protein J6B86_02885 [Clostridia bacterium]|nr:hypothetical protein [Clostridia bacterium]
MRSFLTFLSLFTLFFFLTPTLCLSTPPKTDSDSEAFLLPQEICYGDKTLPAADLILGAVGAMGLQGYHPETLKAAAVVAATKLTELYRETGKADGLEILTAEEAKAAWGDYWFSQYWKEMQEAVTETWGEIITQNGTLYGEAETFPVSWGNTEIGVECPLDETSNDFSATVTVPLEEFTAVFPHYGESLKVKNAQSGRVDTVTSGSTVLTGIEMMQRFSLPSPAFTLTVTADSATFRCKGKGDGIGMSLYGANEMAKQGIGYREIIATFYPDTEIQEANRELGSK